MILVPISRLMQQQHASNFVQCDTGPEPPAPAPESPMSGIISVCALHYGQVLALIWTKLQQQRRRYFSLVHCDTAAPSALLSDIGSLSLLRVITSPAQDLTSQSAHIV